MSNVEGNDFALISCCLLHASLETGVVLGLAVDDLLKSRKEMFHLSVMSEPKFGDVCRWGS